MTPPASPPYVPRRLPAAETADEELWPPPSPMLRLVTGEFLNQVPRAAGAAAEAIDASGALQRQARPDPGLAELHESRVSLRPGSAMGVGFDAAQDALDAAWERYLRSLALTPDQDLMTWQDAAPRRDDLLIGATFEESLRLFGEKMLRTAVALDFNHDGKEDWSHMASFPPWGSSAKPPIPAAEQVEGRQSSHGEHAVGGAWHDGSEPEDPPGPSTPDLL